MAVLRGRLGCAVGVNLCLLPHIMRLRLAVLIRDSIGPNWFRNEGVTKILKSLQFSTALTSLQ
jgi:hypothetical protein